MMCPGPSTRRLTVQSIRLDRYKEVNPYHKEASFLALNPKGLVPTMEFKGVPRESLLCRLQQHALLPFLRPFLFRSGS